MAQSDILSIQSGIKENTREEASVTISSPLFTIYAFEELRKVLEKTGKFKFLFNEPTFIKKIINNDKETILWD